MPTALKDKAKITRRDLKGIRIAHGGHPDRTNGLCSMELVCWLAGEKHSDRPRCTSPIIAAFVRNWNDGLPSDEDRTRLLGPLLPKLVGTVNTASAEKRRGWMMLDFHIRTQTPAWLRVAGLITEAEAIEALSEIVGESTLAASGPAVKAAKEKAAAARAAARAAAWAAAGDAAWAAAGDAAWAAAWAAAGDAAWAAAGAKLAPVVTDLQAKAVALIERMIEVK